MTVHPRVCVSGISTWNQSVGDDLALYEELGIHTIGASLRKLAADEDVDRLAGSGLTVANVIGVGHSGLTHALDVAHRLSAPAVVFTTGPAGGLEWDEAADQLTAALLRVPREPVRLCLEHTNSLRVDVSFVHTLRDAIDVARRLDIDVCMEINACWAERGLADTIQNGIDAITIVQLSDYEIGTKSTPNRLVPGDGDIPMERIIGQVLAAGYQGPFDLEMIGPRIDDEGYASSSKRAVEYVGDLLTTLGP